MKRSLLFRFSIFCIVILGLNINISKAWTFDQFLEYCEQIKIADDSTQLMKRAANLVITRKNKLIDLGIRNYTSFNLNYNTTGWVELLAGTGTYTITSANSTSIGWTPSTGWHQFRIDHNSVAVYDGGNTTSSSLSAANRLGLIEFTNEELIPSNFWLQNKYSMPMEFVPVRNALINYDTYQNVNAINVNYNNLWQPLGYLYALKNGNDYYTFVWLDSNGYEISRLEWNTSITENFQQGNLYFTPQTKNLYVSTRLLYMRNVYTLAIYSSNIDNSILNSNDSLVFTYVAMNIGTTYSGDNILSIGSGDGYSTQNAINDQISWWEQTYNNLFTLDSGDVADIYYNLEGKLTSGDTPLISFTAFLDILGQEPGDFIISWENIPINLTFGNGITLVSGDLISGDSINFSALAREVDSLATVKFWINTVLSFSVITILNFEVYRIVLKALGVATDLYNEADDEERTTLTDTVTSGTVTNTTTGEVRDQNIRKTRTISHTRRL